MASPFPEQITDEEWAAVLASERERLSKLGRSCKHQGFTFEKHGRCCHLCGAVIVDFGD